MTPDDLMRSMLARLEALEAEQSLRRESRRRRASLLALAGKLCPALAVLGLAGWVLAQGVEIRTEDAAAAERTRFKVESGANEVNAWFEYAKLGIGTSAPAQELHVSGTADPVAVMIDGVGNFVVPNLIFRSKRAAADPASNNSDDLAVILARGYDGAAYNSSGAIVVTASEDWNATNNGARMIFQTAKNGTTARTERMRIDHNGDIRVQSSQFRLANLSSVTETALAGGLYYDTDDNRVKYYDGSGWVEMTGTGDDDFIKNQTAADQAAGFRINGKGQIGGNAAYLGTAKLNVYDGGESATLTNFTQALTTAGINITTDYTVNAYTPGIFWSTQNDNATKPKAGIWLLEDGSGTDLYFGTSNNYATGVTNNGLVLDQTGQVGIWTAGPGARLDVADAGAAAGAKLILVGDDAFLSDLDTANTLGIYGNQDSTIASVKLGSGGGVISGYGGNIGIGTATPGALLEVAGEVRVTTTSPQIKFNDSDAGAWKYWIHNNSDRLYFLNDGGAGGGWTGSRPLTIHQDNVGIGTSTATTGKLTITSSTNGVNGLEINHSGLDTGDGDALGITCSSGNGANALDVVTTNAANTFATIYARHADANRIVLGTGQGHITLGVENTSADGNDFGWYVGDGTTAAQRTMKADAYYTAGAAGGGNDQRRLRWNWNGTIVANITGTGNEYCDLSFIGGGAVDFAECVHTDDPTLEAAEVVLIDPARPNQVVRSSRPYDPTIMGIVSERPGVLLGAGCAFPIDMTAGWDVEHDKAAAEPAITRWAALRSLYEQPYTPAEMELRSRLTARSGEVDEMRFCILTNRTVDRETGRPCIQRPVAMLGRVPVKVTGEGGPIRIGDLITTSSTPGRAMKAAEPWRGGILGTALEAFDPADHNARGAILVYVNPNPAPSDVKTIEGLSGSNEDLRGRVAALEAEVGAVREARAALDAERAEMRDLLRRVRGWSPQGPEAKNRVSGPVSRADWE